MKASAIGALIIFLFPLSSYAQIRHDHFAQNVNGLKIHIRSIKPEKKTALLPVVLIHGGGGGSVATFDVDVKGYSLAEDFVKLGYPVFLVNLVGWEKSDRPQAFNKPAAENRPQVNSEEAVQDISSAIEWICKQENVSKINLFGWASGGHWAAMYTSRFNERVNKLIMVNAMYSVDAPWRLADGVDPTKVEAYRLATADALVRRWQTSIPSSNKGEWRDSTVVKAYQTRCLENDPTSSKRTPPSVQIPYGYWRDHLELSKGKKFYEASKIKVPVLLIRGGLDFWSRPEDLATLKSELVNSPEVVVKEIPNGTHFLFFDKPIKGRDEFISSLSSFLNKK